MYLHKLRIRLRQRKIILNECLREVSKKDFNLNIEHQKTHKMQSLVLKINVTELICWEWALITASIIYLDVDAHPFNVAAHVKKVNFLHCLPLLFYYQKLLQLISAHVLYEYLQSLWLALLCTSEKKIKKSTFNYLTNHCNIEINRYNTNFYRLIVALRPWDRNYLPISFASLGRIFSKDYLKELMNCLKYFSYFVILLSF